MLIGIIGTIGIITMAVSNQTLSTTQKAGQLKTKRTTTEDITKRGEEYWLNKTNILSEEDNFRDMILKRNDHCYTETNKAHHWEQQIEDRTSTKPAVTSAKTFTTFMNQLKHEVITKYYESLLSEQEKIEAKFEMQQNTKIKSQIWHADKEKSCINTKITSVILTILPQKDGRKFTEIKQGTNRFTSSNPYDKDKIFWINPYSFKVNTNPLNFWETTIAQGRPIISHKNTHLIFYNTSNILNDKMTVITPTNERIYALVTCPPGKEEEVEQKWITFTMGTTLTIPATCGLISEILNMTQLTLDIKENGIKRKPENEIKRANIDTSAEITPYQDKKVKPSY